MPHCAAITRLPHTVSRHATCSCKTLSPTWIYVVKHPLSPNKSSKQSLYVSCFGKTQAWKDIPTTFSVSNRHRCGAALTLQSSLLAQQGPILCFIFAPWLPLWCATQCLTGSRIATMWCYFMFHWFMDHPYVLLLSGCLYETPPPGPPHLKKVSQYHL